MKTENQKIRFGVIGAGRMGQIHARNLARGLDRVELKAISDANASNAKKLADDLNVEVIEADSKKVLTHPEIDAVVIASPTDTHAEMIETAATAGKHIFCEKPIDMDLGKIQHVLSVVEKAGVHFQTGFNRRFDPNFRKVSEVIKSGQIGTPQLVRIASRDPQPPSQEFIKSSGGLFQDMMIHDFDMARFLVQSEVKEVYATGSVLIDPVFKQFGDVDTAVVVLTFESGAICTIDNSRKAVYGYDQRVEVFGSKGNVMISNAAANNAVIWDEGGVRSEKFHHHFLERYTEAFFAEMKMFVDSLSFNKAVPVSGKDGQYAAMIALAAEKSIKEKRPVFLKEII